MQNLQPVSPEVLLLRPRENETLRELAWQCLCVEFGAHFAFDDEYQLPDEIPADLSGVKAIVMDAASWEYYHAGASGERIRKFLDGGGVIFETRGPTDFSPMSGAMDENAIRGDVDMMLASGDITLNNSALRERLQNRTLRELYESLREPYFSGQIEIGLKRGGEQLFSEPFCYNILQTMELLEEYDPEFGWHERLQSTLDAMLPHAPEAPPHTDGLSHMGVFVRMAQRTSEVRHLELATRLLKYVEEKYPRIDGVPALKPDRDRVVWIETCCHFAPSAVAVGVATNDESLTALGLHALHKIYDLNFDPHTKLWRHWGATRADGSIRQAPAFWGRGNAWALTAIHGVLHSLPEDHPERARILSYLQESIEGVLAYQNEEGLWHNVVDNPQSRVCARASAMICYLLAESHRAGWTREAGIESKVIESIVKSAWRGVRGRVWRDKLCNTCCGTGAGATYQHYMARPQLFYGAAAALRAGVAAVLAFGEEIES